jgi:hypothetical protein
MDLEAELEELPGHDPAFVRRSQYLLVRALLVIATIAVAALTVTVVLLVNAGQEADVATAGSVTVELDYGGFNPSTGRPDSAPLR